MLPRLNESRCTWQGQVLCQPVAQIPAWDHCSMPVSKARPAQGVADRRNPRARRGVDEVTRLRELHGLDKDFLVGGSCALNDDPGTTRLPLRSLRPRPR